MAGWFSLTFTCLSVRQKTLSGGQLELAPKVFSLERVTVLILSQLYKLVYRLVYILTVNLFKLANKMPGCCCCCIRKPLLKTKQHNTAQTNRQAGNKTNNFLTPHDI